MTISRDERLELADLIDQDKLDTLDDLGTHQRCLIVAALRAQAERAPVAYLHRYKGSVIEPQLGFEMAINPQWTSEPLYLATPIAGQRQEDPDDGSYTSDPRIGRQMTATERAAWAAIPQPASAAPQQSPIERLDMREIAAHLHDQGLSPDKAGEIAHSLMQRFDIGLRQSPPRSNDDPLPLLAPDSRRDRRANGPLWIHDGRGANFRRLPPDFETRRRADNPPHGVESSRGATMTQPEKEQTPEEYWRLTAQWFRTKNVGTPEWFHAVDYVVSNLLADKANSFLSQEQRP